MPEGKKKDSFTFSDKIKNSKPAGSKSFANRIFSKIGKDGKPRQTLYERTRRDAPFFIAAVIALLLLPFLYKYSGSVGDEEISPIKGDLIQDPDSRDGYYSFVDPGSSTLAPYPGNDTALLLVKPFAGEDSEAITEEQVPEVYTPASSYSERDSYADTSASKKASKLRDKETNILNEYRKRAAATTRKAFKRTPTKINSLGSAGLRRPNGSKLGVNMWGGGLKGAAKRVPNGPTEGPKPVSLQPLTAAGKPSRSSFGQGHLAAAQKSKDAMSKGNPMEALRDAQVRALGNNRTGGMDFDRNPFGPGGGGQLKREFNYQGQKPWWWDMMQTRMQRQWEKMFEYKWGWIDWATDLLRNILGGVLNCLITGQDDGSMGSMFGVGAAGNTKEATCCGKGASKIGSLIKSETGLDFSKEGCNNLKTKLELSGGSCPGGWKEPVVVSGSGGKVGFWQQRKACLGVASNFKGAAAIDFDESTSCNLFNTTNGTVWYFNAVGEAMDWYKYIYVIADNEAPNVVKLNFPDVQYLCGQQDTTIRVGRTRSGAGRKKNKEGGYDESRYTVTDRSTNQSYHTEAGTALDKCVIDVQAYSKGSVASFDYNVMKKHQVEAFEELLADAKGQNGCAKDLVYTGNDDKGQPICDSLQNAAEKAFNQLKLRRVEGMAAKNHLAYESDVLEEHALPMPYLLFKDAYIARSGMTAYPYSGETYKESPIFRFKRGFKSRKNLDGGNPRIEGENRLWGLDNNDSFGQYGCNWVNTVKIACSASQSQDAVSAQLTYVNLQKSDGKVLSDQTVDVTATFEQQEETKDENGNTTYTQIKDLDWGNFKNLSGSVQPDGKNFTVASQTVTIFPGGATSKEVQEARSWQGFVKFTVTKKGDPSVTLAEVKCPFNAQVAPVVEERKTDVGEKKANDEIIELMSGFKDKLPCGTYQSALVNSYWAAKYGSRVLAEVNKKLAADHKTYPWKEGAEAQEYKINGDTYKVSEGEDGGFVPFGEKGEYKASHYLPTLGELMAVAKIGEQYGVDTAMPKNVVCAIGGLLSALSEDQTIFPSIKSSLPADLKTNGFGAFLAHIGTSAVLWPSNKTSVSGYNGINPRFQGVNEGSRPAAVPGAYHWGYYVRTSRDGKVVGLYKGGYFTQASNQYPLSGMIYKGGHSDFYGYGLKTTADLNNARVEYTNFYSQVLSQHRHYRAESMNGDMCRNSDNTAWLYDENETIPSQDVFTYLTNVCGGDGNGLNTFKPWGWQEASRTQAGKMSSDPIRNRTRAQGEERKDFTKGRMNKQVVDNGN